MPSIIKIRIQSIPLQNDRIIFNTNDNPLGVVSERWKIFPSGIGEVKIPSSLNRVIFNLREAFIRHYNSFDNFNTIITGDGGGGELTITHNDKRNFFDNTRLIGSNWATIISIENTDPIIIPVITNTQFTDINCVSVSAELTFNTNVNSLLLGLTTINNPSNPYTLNLPRGVEQSVFLEGGNKTYLIKTPNLWNIKGINQSITPNGYFIQIEINESGLNNNIYHYSLDNITFTSSNSYIGLLAGNYTIYVKDDYGCEQQLNFEVKEDPFLKVNSSIVKFSKLNSFHFIKSESVNGCDIYSDELNTISHKESIQNNKKFYHLVQKCDCRRGHFWSNQETNEVTLYGCDGLEVMIPIVKKSNNINLFDTRDYIVNMLDGNLIFYSNGGNIYDTETGEEIGKNTIVNDVFTYHKIGTVVNVEGYGYLAIKDIRFSEVFNSWIAITNGKELDLSEYKKITTNYNLKEYEVYEFEVDFQDLEGNYFIGYKGIKDSITTEFVTEYINVLEKHENTHEIIYRNSNNRGKDIDFRTGIYFQIRLPYLVDKVYTPSDENEIYTKDTTVVSLNSDVFDSRTFSFKPMPTAIAVKLNECISNDTLYIDRKQYVKDDSPTIENLGGGSNLYRFVSNLRRASGDLSGLNKLDLSIALIEDSNATPNVIGEGSGFLSLGGTSEGFIGNGDRGFINLK